MLQLRDYQVQAVEFLLSRDRAMVLAQVGAGKTAIALEAMRQLGGRWLVLAPKRVATDVWPQEIQKWGGSGTAAIDVLNYEMIHKLTSLNIYVGVVFDELTRFKNPSGKRFKMFEKLLKESPGVRYRYGLTGSFTSNGLEDCFGECKIVDQVLLGRAKGAFLQQYFYCVNRDWGEWAPIPGSLEKVMDRIKPATFVLEAKEYQDRLPPLHVVELRCDHGNRKPYEDMRKHYVAELGDKQITALSAAAVSGKLQQMASGFVYDANWSASNPNYDYERRAEWFSPHKFDRLDELLQENQRANTIVVYNFVEELNELRRRYPKAVAVTDNGAIDLWNAGKVEILLVHPKSAGHGIQLQFGGHHLVFLSLPWSQELYEQTIGRIRRSGQTHPCWVYVMLTNKTIDEKIYAALADKKKISEVAMAELMSC